LKQAIDPVFAVGESTVLANLDRATVLPALEQLIGRLERDRGAAHFLEMAQRVRRKLAAG
jgi:hypothetical protein